MNEVQQLFEIVNVVAAFLPYLLDSLLPLPRVQILNRQIIFLSYVCQRNSRRVISMPRSGCHAQFLNFYG